MTVNSGKMFLFVLSDKTKHNAKISFLILLKDSVYQADLYL